MVHIVRSVGDGCAGHAKPFRTWKKKQIFRVLQLDFMRY